ncbi:cbb3-type cytochrome c oxidase subunit I [Flagellimonas sp. HMM57]|uniref:cbb3-type cytochrome c oxidase subunit I n=1 Tax=unclassified Flagellimonas TaxID=2644544 RepID=UPI0013D1C586|nr:MULTISPECIES: cbb3-type cytochrome c oxidase subunit I [unclassified Flagellimonas]UII75158.1 cbb3-type cytochrome c oxidase subunit I [Flagellimonas sp. HMM57]
MNKLIEKPHLIFLLAIPIILLTGILSGDAILDINVHDTYYVITYLHFAILISTFFGIIGIGYWIIQKVGRKLSKWLNWIHIGLTFGGTIVVWILAKFYRTEIMEYEFNNNLTLIITSIVLLMTVGQLIFPINIIYGLTKKKNE